MHTVQILRILCGCFFLLALNSVGNAQPRTGVESFRFHDIELRTGLDSLVTWYAVPILFLEKDIAGKKVTAECNSCTFEEALRALLHKHDLTWKVLDRQVIIQQRQAAGEQLRSTLAGTVCDSLTGERIIGGNVLLQSSDKDGQQRIHRWGATNDFGFFSLRNVEPGRYTLVLRSLGYRALAEEIVITGDESSTREFALVEQHLTLPEITIEGRRSVLAASEGISRGIYIRATPSDANQYHFEGARIYNPNHYGGILSAFSSDALRDVHRIAGGVPPSYGGRIGGILDVTLREGTMEGITGIAGVGSLGSNLILEGPVDSRTTFLISGRKGYPDLLLPAQPAGGTPSDLNSNEVMVKVSHRLSGSDRLFLSGYFARDAFERSTLSTFGVLDNSLQWDNAAANLRWISGISPSLFVHASAVFTRYSFNTDQRVAYDAGPASNTIPPESFPSYHSIQDIAVRAHAEHFYDEFHTFRGGVDLIRHAMHGTISEFSTQRAPFSLNRFSSWELSIYLQDQWRFTSSVSAEVGARATAFIGAQGTFSAIDPRFSLLASLPEDWRFHASLTSINQFTHPYRSSGLFLFYPTVFFYPSTDQIRPTTSLQVSLGMAKDFRASDLIFSAEAYYRVTQKLHEFAFDSAGSETLNTLALFGEGTTYGAEVTLNKRAGDFKGTVRYSLSWAENRFSELNAGNPFTPPFHRGDELFVSLSYSLSENWGLAVTCLLTSSQSETVPSTTKNALFGEGGDPIRATEGSQFDGDLNGGRIPGFQRLELKVLHRFALWGVPMHASLGMMNGYGLLDPFVFTLHHNADKRLRWSATLDAPEIFPLYPVVNVSLKF